MTGKTSAVSLSSLPGGCPQQRLCLHCLDTVGPDMGYLKVHLFFLIPSQNLFNACWLSKSLHQNDSGVCVGAAFVCWTVRSCMLSQSCFNRKSHRPLKIHFGCEFSVLCAFGYLVENPLRVWVQFQCAINDHVLSATWLKIHYECEFNFSVP